jgi:hypothetical protein
MEARKGKQDGPKPTGVTDNKRGFLMRKAHWLQWVSASLNSAMDFRITFDFAHEMYLRSQLSISAG